MTPKPITITIDFERSHPAATVDDARRAIEPLLAVLDQTATEITVFVVGEIARESAPLLKSISERGHEIALHGFTHTPLAALGPDRFREDLEQGKSILEETVGMRVAGFRAPYFSLTAKTLWAPSILAECGFEYSSSVLPVWNPQFGFPSAPKIPFLWPDELVELPSPVLAIGPAGLPVLGGAYLRLAPEFLVSWATKRAQRNDAGWTYCHPYDFDVDEPIRQRDGESKVFRWLLYSRRAQMLPRIQNFIAPPAGPLAEVSRSLRQSGNLITWNP